MNLGFLYLSNRNRHESERIGKMPIRGSINSRDTRKGVKA
jgi:hypothetical protein